MKRTPGRERELRAIADTEHQRELARSVSCDDCGARIGRPCRTSLRHELRAEHPRRLLRATRMREAGEIACTYCQRLELDLEGRELVPYPEVIEMCEGHQRLYDQLAEALNGPRMEET